MQKREYQLFPHDAALGGVGHPDCQRPLGQPHLEKGPTIISGSIAP
jgi:hypothetical protein